MTVAVVGSGPAVEAVEAALADVDVPVTTPGIDGVADATLAVVVGLAGSDGFERANRVAADAGVPWVAVELGGVGGRPTDGVAAAVSGFTPDSGCYHCLRTRVDAAAEGDPAPRPTATKSDARLAGAVAGRQVVGSLSGDPFAGEVVELPYARRRFLPVPGCPVCDGERDRSLPREHRAVGLENALGRAELAVDDRVGVVTGVGEQHSFPAPYYLAVSGDTAGFSDASAASQAAGVGADWNEAYMKALGEALERYSAGVYREAEFTVAPAGDVTNPLTPDRFVRPDGYPALDPDEAVAWVPGEELSSGDRAHLLAEFVQFPPPEERFKPAITTGLGLGNSPVEALLSGLYEVVERDATMLAWYSTFEPMGLSVADETFRTVARRARSEDLTVTPLLVTQDVDVPVVAVAVHRDGDWPRFALGSAADLDAAAAARSALTEALQNWMELRSMGPERSREAGGAIGRYADFPREVRGLVVDETVPAASVGPADVPTGADELDAVVDRLADAGVETYAARITPRDVDSLGFEAVRVLAPEAQPLFTGDAYYGERAKKVPRDLGFRPRLDRPYHPYP